jgi:hypothetical protein
MDRRSGITAARVTAALTADVGRGREISAHNTRTAASPDEERPRAFIHFPTQSYELLIFGGHIPSLTSPETLDAVMAYLQQAEHVNAMLRLFEQIEVQGAALSGSPLAGKKDTYLRVIKDYCAVDMPAALQRVDRALGTGATSRTQ